MKRPNIILHNEENIIGYGFKLEHLKNNAAFFNLFEKLAPLTPAHINATRKNKRRIRAGGKKANKVCSVYANATENVDELVLNYIYYI